MVCTARAPLPKYNGVPLPNLNAVACRPRLRLCDAMDGIELRQPVAGMWSSATRHDLRCKLSGFALLRSQRWGGNALALELPTPRSTMPPRAAVRPSLRQTPRTVPVDRIALRVVFGVPLHPERKGRRVRDADRLDGAVLGDTLDQTRLPGSRMPWPCSELTLIFSQPSSVRTRRPASASTS